MKENVTAPRSIEGDWNWRESCVNRQNGWVALEETSEGERIWSFIGGSTMSYTEGNLTRSICEYRYDPDKLLLSIKGFDIDANGKPLSKTVQEYRVEFSAPAEMYLYELEDELDEDEPLRLTLRKI